MTNEPTTWLEPQEVKQLSGKEKPSAQVRALRKMNIEHQVRADGAVLVLRSYIERLFGDTPSSSPRAGGKPPAPNWDAL